MNDNVDTNDASTFSSDAQRVLIEKAENEPTELRDLEINEISIVTQGANRKRFRILKAGDAGKGAPEVSMEELQDEALAMSILKETPEDGIREAIEKELPGLTPDATEVATDIVKLAKAVAEDLPSEFFDVLAEVAGFEKAAKPPEESPEEEAAETPADEEEEEEEEVDAQKGEKKVAKEADESEVKKALETIEKEADIDSLPEDIQKAVRPLYKAYAEAKDEVRKMKDEALTKEYIAKAAEFTHLAKSDNFATLLKSMAEKLTPEEFAEVDGIFKSNENALRESGLFSEAGSAAAPSATPEGQLAAMARDRVAKAEDGSITFEKAYADVTMEHPELYDEMQKTRGIR